MRGHSKCETKTAKYLILYYLDPDSSKASVHECETNLKRT